VMAAVSYLVGLWGIVATSSPPESQRTSD